jgi:hypothetical protein
MSIMLFNILLISLEISPLVQAIGEMPPDDQLRQIIEDRCLYITSPSRPVEHASDVLQIKLKFTPMSFHEIDDTAQT